MRFMMMVKADKTTEAGALPSEKDLEVMGKYNEELVFDQLPHDGRVPEVELRQFFELEDFPVVPPAVAEMEKSFKREK